MRRRARWPTSLTREAPTFSTIGEAAISSAIFSWSLPHSAKFYAAEDFPGAKQALAA
jgi:hypothetical protein